MVVFSTTLIILKSVCRNRDLTYRVRSETERNSDRQATELERLAPRRQHRHPLNLPNMAYRTNKRVDV